MTEQQHAYRSNKAGAGRNPKIKNKLYNKLQVIFTPADYDRLLKLKAISGRTLQDIGSSAILNHLTNQGF